MPELVWSMLALIVTVSIGPGPAPAWGQDGVGGGFTLPPLMITSPAFEDGAIIPDEYAGRSGISPELNWTGAPEGTVSYAIIFHDMDVAFGGGTDDLLHWIMWNIPGNATGLPRGGIPSGTVQGVGLGGNAYFGPGAPRGERYHHYVFELYALNTMLELSSSAGRPELVEAMGGHVVAKASYVGRFHE